MDEQTNPNTNPVQTPVADPNAPVVPTTPVKPATEVPGEVSSEVPAGAPVDETEEVKTEDAPAV